MKKSLPSDLASLGLSEKEVLVYLALLSRGTATVQDLAFDSGVKRTTIYPVLNSLQEKGLVNADISSLKKAYTLSSVSALRELIKRKITSFESTLIELEHFEAHSANTTHGVKFYRGLAAVKGLYDNVLSRLKPSHFYWAISDQDKWMTTDTKYFLDFKHRRSKLSLDVRLLLTASAATYRNQQISGQFGERIRILPKESKLSLNSLVTPFCYVLHALDPTPSAVLIEIAPIVQSQTEHFRLLWNAHRESAI